MSMRLTIKESVCIQIVYYFLFYFVIINGFETLLKMYTHYIITITFITELKV